MPKNLNEDVMLGDILHEWTIQEYENHSRGVWWYIIMISLGLVLVVYGVFTANFLFSLIIILFAIIMFLQSHNTPPQINFKITEMGIILGSKFYSYSEFESFWIIYSRNGAKVLFLDMRSTLQPMLRIPLLDMDPLEVKYSLREYLAENLEREEEPLSDRVSRNWKI